jgi:hypothetical protein
LDLLAVDAVDGKSALLDLLAVDEVANSVRRWELVAEWLGFEVVPERRGAFHGCCED